MPTECQEQRITWNFNKSIYFCIDFGLEERKKDGNFRKYAEVLFGDEIIVIKRILFDINEKVDAEFMT